MSDSEYERIARGTWGKLTPSQRDVLWTLYTVTVNSNNLWSYDIRANVAHSKSLKGYVEFTHGRFQLTANGREMMQTIYDLIEPTRRTLSYFASQDGEIVATSDPEQAHEYGFSDDWKAITEGRYRFLLWRITNKSLDLPPETKT